MCSCTTRGWGEVTGDGTRTPLVVEVTDTLGAPFTTGIQRVVREVLRRLDEHERYDDLEIVPVLTPAPGAGFRRLSAEEAERLRHHPAGGRAGRRADDFGRLAPLVRRIADTPNAVRLRTAVARVLPGRRRVHPEHPELAYDPPDGAVFLDLEGSWYDPTPRHRLLPELRARGVRPMVFVHDVMPVVHPEWFTPRHISVFRSWLDAHLLGSSTLLANSRCTAGDVEQVARTHGLQRTVTVVPLGGDPMVETARHVDLPDEIGRALLVVGTLEPRKNQALVLDAFDQLSRRHADLGLLLVGKEGWMVDDLVERVRTHPEHGRRLLWLGGIDDAQLTSLYQQAFLCIAPSRYEGLGVPVTEALAQGRATLASTGGAQPEAAGGAAELFEPDDLQGLVELVRRHLEDPRHHEHWERRAREHTAPSWADTTEAIAAAVREVAAR